MAVSTLTLEFREALERIADAISSGRLGFDCAIKEYAYSHENTLAHALREFVREMNVCSSISRTHQEEMIQDWDEIRCRGLHKVASQLNLPELDELIHELTCAPIDQISVVKILRAHHARL